MAMTIQEFFRLADPDLDKIWHEDDPSYEEQYSRVLKVESLDNLYKREAEMAGFGSPIAIDEGDDVTYDEAISPREKRFDIEKFGLGYKVTDKFWMNDRYGEVKQFEADLKRADQDHTETYFFAVLANATNTTISTGLDGVALASTAHIRMDGGASQANRPSTLTALSLTALEDAAIAFTKFKTERGRPYRSVPNKLLTGLDLVLVANEILASAMNPTTTNNATNALRNVFTLDPVSTPYIVSTSYWALLGERHDIQAIWRQRPAQDSKVHFDSGTIKRKTEKWMSRGHGRWLGYYQGNT
jgi:hypothetical protein